MTATTESTKRKLSLLQLAEELGNDSKACQIMGYHRDTFYEVRRAFQVGGVAALVEQKRGPKSPHPNRVAPEIEEQILALCLERPTYGAQRIANELRLQSVDVSPSGVIKGRTTWYISPEEIQRDLDQYLSFYNLKRSHQGYRLKGRTPAQALREALGRKRLPPIVPKENLEVVKEAA